MSISVSQTILQFVSLFCFLLQKYKKSMIPLPKNNNNRLCRVTLLKVLLAISGVFGWFSHLAGKI